MDVVLHLPSSLPFSVLGEFEEARRVFLEFPQLDGAKDTCIQCMWQKFSEETKESFSVDIEKFMRKVQLLLRDNERRGENSVPKTQFRGHLDPLPIKKVPTGLFSCKGQAVLQPKQSVSLSSKEKEDPFLDVQEKRFNILHQFEILKQQVPGFKEWAEGQSFSLNQKESFLLFFKWLRTKPFSSEKISSGFDVFNTLKQKIEKKNFIAIVEKMVLIKDSFVRDQVLADVLCVYTILEERKVEFFAVLQIKEEDLLTLLPLFRGFSEREIDVFIIFCRTLHAKPFSQELIEKAIFFVKDPLLLNFSKRFLLSGTFQYTLKGTALSLLDDIKKLYDVLKQNTKNSQNVSERLLSVFFSQLTHKEIYQLLNNTDNKEYTSFFYASYLSNHLEEDISETPLSLVPVELLIRFLASRPFPVGSGWLKEKIQTSLGVLSRIETLSFEQKKAVLSFFRSEESALPQDFWVTLLGMTQEEVARFGLNESSPCPVEFAKFHEELQPFIDSRDPLSLLYAVRKKAHLGSTRELLIFLLESAQITTACGGRTFLSWGNSSPIGSSCALQDGVPLFGSTKEKTFPIFPQSPFNDFLECPTIRLVREKLLSVKEEGKEIFSLFQKETNPFNYENSKKRALSFELLLLEKSLRERYPQFTSIHSLSLDPESLLSEKVQLAPTFFDSIKLFYKECTELLSSYDCNDYAHRHAILFLALTLLVRNAKIIVENEKITIQVTSAVSFTLQQQDAKTLQFFSKDNPGLQNVDSLRADYQVHTISPLTPAWVPPSAFQAFHALITSLDSTTFDELIGSCLPLLNGTFEDTSDTGDYFDEWKKLWPKKVNLTSFKSIISFIVRHYAPSVDHFTMPPEPNKVYRLDPHGIGVFCSSMDVPSFLRSQGSFASIICRFFIPIKPESTDGSCGVNAFLLGKFGPEAYQGKRNLAADIHEFRERIVRFATSHYDELLQDIGKKNLDDLISRYESSSIEWTGREVWTIAARLFKQRINIFNCDGHEGLFRTDSSGVITLFDKETESFSPSQETTKPDINLLLYGPHYVYLQRR